MPSEGETVNYQPPAHSPKRAEPRSPKVRAQTRLALASLPGAVPCARLHAREVLWEWGLAALGDVVELVLAELMTNAVVHASHSRGGDGPAQVIFRLSARDEGVRIEVWDTDPRLPRMKPGVSALDETGRGLHLVDALSRGRWGSTPGVGGGKVVWADVT
jgi:anti-sigma regulatory factor (Ser/Thr protein kinase)